MESMKRIFLKKGFTGSHERPRMKRFQNLAYKQTSVLSFCSQVFGVTNPCDSYHRPNITSKATYVKNAKTKLVCYVSYVKLHTSSFIK